MSIFQIVLSAEFIFALGIYAITIMVALPCFDRIHTALGHSVLQWPWDHIGMPLLRAALMMIFTLLAYPIIFGLNEAPSLIELHHGNEQRLNYLINILFLVTLFLPVMPVLGDWEELVLPIQAITACCLLFSWLVAELGISDIRYWPGLSVALYILILAFATHWMALALSHYLGEIIDEKFSVTDSGHLLSRALVLLMQSPAILIFSAALGRQLT